MSDDKESNLIADIKDELTKIVKQQGIKNPTLTATKGSALGDNYLGDIINVIATGKDEKGKEESLDLIVKCAPKNNFFRGKFPVRDVYLREIYVYKKVFKEFIKIQEEIGVKQLFFPFAIYYDNIHDEGVETLIMRNMKKMGFEMQDRMKPLDYDHVSLVMRSYGKMHALSFALRHHRPEVFREMADNLQECFMVKMPPEVYLDLTQLGYDCLDGPLKEKFHEFRSKLPDNVLMELSEEAAGEYAVIGHGDSWTNNFLFKYGDNESPNKPTEMIFLDWQLSRMSAPVVDLGYFVYTCTDKSFRDKYYAQIFDEYYNSLSSFLKGLDCDPEQLYPREVFEEHLKRFMGYGLYMAVMVLRATMCEKDDVIDFKNMTEEEIEAYRKERKEHKISKSIQIRVKEVIEDCERYGYVGLN